MMQIVGNLGGTTAGGDLLGGAGGGIGLPTAAPPPSPGAPAAAPSAAPGLDPRDDPSSELYWFIRNEHSPWSIAGYLNYGTWQAAKQASETADAQYRQNQIDLQYKQLAQGGSGTALGWANLANTQSNQALQAQLNQAQLELQKAQFEYGKARDAKDFTAQQYWQGRQDYWTSRKDDLDRAQLDVQRGTALLNVGQRPESLIRYLYALAGQQAPQGGETAALPGFGPGPLGQPGAPTVGAAPGAAPAGGPATFDTTARVGGATAAAAPGSNLLPQLRPNQATGRTDNQGNPIMTTAAGEKISGTGLLDPTQVALRNELMRAGANSSTFQQNAALTGGGLKAFTGEDNPNVPISPEAAARNAIADKASGIDVTRDQYGNPREGYYGDTNKQYEGGKVKYMWKGGELTLKSPHALVDLFSNRVAAIAGEQGPERVKFGGAALIGGVDPQAEINKELTRVGASETTMHQNEPAAAAEPTWKSYEPYTPAQTGQISPTGYKYGAPLEQQPQYNAAANTYGGAPVGGASVLPPSTLTPAAPVGATSPAPTGPAASIAPPPPSGPASQTFLPPAGTPPPSSNAADLFNPPGLSAQLGGSKIGNLPNFPQLLKATGRTSLIPSRQRWKQLLPTEQDLYRGALTDIWGIPSADVESLMAQLSPRNTGAPTTRYRSSY